MKIRILMLGKNKDSYISEGVADFSKKIAPFAELDLSYLKDERVHEDIKKILEKEAETLQQNLRADEYVIVLDDQGKVFTTEQLEGHFTKLKDQGIGKICFLIGSSHGLAPEVVQNADLVLSLSALTMNHQIVRLVLLEQLYRVFTIQRGMKYHK